jgi:hypothetical protein
MQSVVWVDVASEVSRSDGDKDEFSGGEVDSGYRTIDKVFKQDMYIC